MSQLHPIHNCDKPDRSLDLIFIHGVDGDYKTTWCNDKGISWMDWLGEDQVHIGVWSLAYEASLSKWREESMPLADQADTVLQNLYLRGIGKRPVAFIGHSMGGIVIKQLLMNADISHNPDWKSISEKTCGIVFIASPHSGVNLANFAKHIQIALQANDHINELEQHNSRLRQLHTWFLGFHNTYPFECLAFYETRPLYPKLGGFTLPFGGIIIVDATSANPNIADKPAFGLPANHTNICKPSSREDTLYLSVLDWLNKIQSVFAIKKIPNPGTDNVIVEVDIIMNSKTAQELYNLFCGYRVAVSDLEDFAFLAGVYLSDLIDGGTKKQKATELINDFDKRNQLPRLIAAVRKSRPDLDPLLPNS